MTSHAVPSELKATIRGWPCGVPGLRQRARTVGEAAGFVQEGTLRQSYRYADGAYHDEHLHALLSTDLD